MKKEINTVPQLITGSFLTNSQVEKLKDIFRDFTVVVRCEKCIYGDDFDCPAPLPTGCLCQKGHGSHTGDWFCADGKMR